MYSKEYPWHDVCVNVCIVECPCHDVCVNVCIVGSILGMMYLGVFDTWQESCTYIHTYIMPGVLVTISGSLQLTINIFQVVPQALEMGMFGCSLQIAKQLL